MTFTHTPTHTHPHTHPHTHTRTHTHIIVVVKSIKFHIISNVAKFKFKLLYNNSTVWTVCDMPYESEHSDMSAANYRSLCIAYRFVFRGQ